MTIHTEVPDLDKLLDERRSILGEDYVGYKNHCYRVLNFCLALSDERPETWNKVAIAVAFHDLGIWAKDTFDYLDPSILLARKHLAEQNREGWQEEIESMTDQHHKITRSTSNPAWLVEPFRKADWIDVSKGVLTFGLSASFVKEVLASIPNAGFHRRLIGLTWRQFRLNPTRPLPMMKW
jgi:hypothetical protein